MATTSSFISGVFPAGTTLVPGTNIPGYPYYEPTTDLQGPNPPSWYTVPTGKIAPPAKSVSLAQNAVIPSWLVPYAGMGILLVLASTRFYHPIMIVLIGIIAYWFMKPYV